MLVHFASLSAADHYHDGESVRVVIHQYLFDCPFCVIYSVLSRYSVLCCSPPYV